MINQAPITARRPVHYRSQMMISTHYGPSSHWSTESRDSSASECDSTAMETKYLESVSIKLYFLGQNAHWLEQRELPRLSVSLQFFSRLLFYLSFVYTAYTAPASHVDGEQYRIFIILADLCIGSINVLNAIEGLIFSDTNSQIMTAKVFTMDYLRRNMNVSLEALSSQNEPSAPCVSRLSFKLERTDVCHSCSVPH